MLREYIISESMHYLNIPTTRSLAVVKTGEEVIPVDLRDAYAFGGGLHCCTADVHREGKLKDYFPNQ